MWSIMITALFAVLSVYVGVFGRVVHNYYEGVKDRMKVAQELRSSYREFVLTESGSDDLQYLSLGDVDVKRDNCMQAIYSVCANLFWECQTASTVNIWGWALSAVAFDYSVLDGADYRIEGEVIKLNGAGYVDLRNVPIVSTKVSGCGSNELMSRGRYYYSISGRIVGCDEFVLDLNNVKVSGSDVPCAYMDIVKHR